MITSQRLVFAADKNREWAFDKLRDVSHPTPDLTLLQVSNRKNRSGVRLPSFERDRFRLLLELALADAQGERADVVSRYRDRLARHDQTRPVPPTPPRKPSHTDLTQLTVTTLD
jgi:NOL1/NOP2/fmu family ribosome biogenesis protein